MKTKSTLVGLFFSSLVLAGAPMRPDKDNLVDFALPIVGTDSAFELSNGNLYPAISLPWGAHTWSPQTAGNDTGWFYVYGHRKIHGFRQTHQPSPWIGDYGQFSMMPGVDIKNPTDGGRASWFSHKTETAKPHYYSVYLADYDVTVELAPTCDAAILRLTYPETDKADFVVDAFGGGSITSIDEKKGVVEGWGRNHNFFVMACDHPFVSALVEGVLGILRFPKLKKGEQVNVRVASSFVSLDQARVNLRQVQGEGFDAVVAAGRKAWNEALGRVVIETEDVDRARMFYTCLYRAMLFPRRHFDTDANGKPVHRSPHNNEVLAGRYYGGTGFWDTFRSLFPLLNFLYPEMNKEMTEGLTNCYKEGGWLPEWSAPGFRGCMIGNNSASVVADAFLTGAAKGEDAAKLWEAVVHGANNSHPRITSQGRAAVKEYIELGYVPRDVINESTARTLEYAYDDWCILMFGRLLGRPASELDVYAKRCQNWRNVFNKEVGLACGRKKDGTWDPQFNPYRWGGDFTEGNSLHYTWSVFHDIAALIDAMGGAKAFNDRLDSVFALPPVFDATPYGGVIHEIREMQIMGFGQYAHGNQPIQHMPYLYDWSGEPWKTQKWVNEIMRRLYHPTPDGYCGDEDNGQTSAWYVWGSLGMYPVCPGSGEYALGAPQLASATLTFGKTKLTIKAVLADGSPMKDVDATPYVQRVTLYGQTIDRNYGSRAELVKGGTLSFTMGPKPNLKRGTTAAAAPYSFSREKKK